MSSSAATSRLVAGEPPINFAAHQIRAGNLAGARDDFEQMLAVLITAIHPGARQIAANPGDWGIDVLLGDLSGVVVIWQSKYFFPVVTRAHQAQIRESFDSALAAAEHNGYRLRRWVLCVPASMDPGTARWWDRWSARRRRDTGVVIDLWDETTLREMLARPDAAHVRRHYYDPYAPGADPRPAALHDLPTDISDIYESALFVRQLREAGHAEVESAKHEYFNADLLAREIADKGLRAELEALGEADAVAYGIWEARFNAILQVDQNPMLPGLHAAVMGEIRESGAFPVQLRAGRVHRCGLMHRIVQRRRAGWVRHWRVIAREELS